MLKYLCVLRMTDRKNNPINDTGVFKKLSQKLAKSEMQLLWGVALLRCSYSVTFQIISVAFTFMACDSEKKHDSLTPNSRQYNLSTNHELQPRCHRLSSQNL